MEQGCPKYYYDHVSLDVSERTDASWKYRQISPYTFGQPSDWFR